MAKKSTPATVTHQYCQAVPQWGDWGPHHIRLWCKDHNKFICWLPNDIDLPDSLFESVTRIEDN